MKPITPSDNVVQYLDFAILVNPPFTDGVLTPTVRDLVLEFHDNHESYRAAWKKGQWLFQFQVEDCEYQVVDDITAPGFKINIVDITFPNLDPLPLGVFGKQLHGWELIEGYPSILCVLSTDTQQAILERIEGWHLQYEIKRYAE